MRLLHLVDSSSYNPILVDISKHIDKSRTTLSVATLAPAGELHERLSAMGIATFALDCTRKAHYPGAIVRLAGLLRRQRIEVLHTHLVQSSLIGLAAAFLARTPVRVMTRHHSDAVFLSGNRAALAADRLIDRYLADEIIAVSQATKQAIIEIDGVDESKITIVPNGFDWNRIRSRPEAGRAIREEFGLDHAPVLCTVGRLDRLKGHEVLLRALVEAALPKARLIIVGHGPQKAFLQKMAQDLAIADRCIFTGYRSDVYDIMAASDLIVHPSLSEAHNLAIIEALHLGRPVVATAVGAAREVIIPGKTGWLVPPHDHVALAHSLREALADAEKARAFAQAGQQLVRSMYSIQNMIKGYEAVYARHLSIR